MIILFLCHHTLTNCLVRQQHCYARTCYWTCSWESSVYFLKMHFTVIMFIFTLFYESTFQNISPINSACISYPFHLCYLNKSQVSNYVIFSSSLHFPTSALHLECIHQTPCTHHKTILNNTPSLYIQTPCTHHKTILNNTPSLYIQSHVKPSFTYKFTSHASVLKDHFNGHTVSEGSITD
jgi:hypothetical protein